MRTEKKLSVTIKYLILGMIGLAVSLLVASRFTNPNGQYRVDAVASEGVAFYEVKDGVIRLIVPEAADEDTNYSVEVIATYRKEGREWIATNPDGERFKIKANFFTIRFIQSGHTTDRFPKIFLKHDYRK